MSTLFFMNWVFTIFFSASYILHESQSLLSTKLLMNYRQSDYIWYIYTCISVYSLFKRLIITFMLCLVKCEKEKKTENHSRIGFWTKSVDIHAIHAKIVYVHGWFHVFDFCWWCTAKWNYQKKTCLFLVSKLVEDMATWEDCLHRQ